MSEPEEIETDESVATASPKGDQADSLAAEEGTENKTSQFQKGQRDDSSVNENESNETQDVAPKEIENAYEFNESNVNKSIIGDNATQQFFGENYRFTDRSWSKPFPQPNQSYSQDFLQSLKPFQAFLSQHNWLITLRNEDNISNHLDMLSQLIQCEDQRDYRIQSDNIECRDYLRHKDVLSYGQLTITKCIVRGSSKILEFFKEPENVSELTKQLQKSQNCLVLVVDVESTKQFIEEFQKYLTPALKEHSVWIPMPEEVTEQRAIDVSDMTIVEKGFLSIASWFDCLPYNLFQSVLNSILLERSESIKQKSEDASDPDWWLDWQENPDLCFSQLGLTNSPLHDDNSYSIYFENSGHQKEYRKLMTSSGMYELKTLWPNLKHLFFKKQPVAISDALWERLLAPQLAKYMQAMHSVGVITVDKDFLIDLYEDVRYAHQDEFQCFLRFTQLIKQLHQKENCRTAVMEFFEIMQQAMESEQRQLISEINNNIDLLRSLPRQMPELAKLAKAADQSAARKLFLLKDRIYANCILIKVVFNIGSAEFMYRFLSVFNRFSIKKDFGGEYLPVVGIYIYFLKNILSNSVAYFLAFISQLNEIDPDNDNNSSDNDSNGNNSNENKLVLSVTREILISTLDRKSTGLTSVKGINFLFELLIQSQGRKAIIQLLYPDNDEFEDYTCELLYTLIRMKTLLELKDSEDKRLDTSIESLLPLCAQSLSKTRFLEIKSLCMDLYVNSRSQLINNRNKDSKQTLIAYKKACLFIKKSFKKHGGKIQ